MSTSKSTNDTAPPSSASAARPSVPLGNDDVAFELAEELAAAGIAVACRGKEIKICVLDGPYGHKATGWILFETEQDAGRFVEIIDAAGPLDINPPGSMLVDANEVGSCASVRFSPRDADEVAARLKTWNRS